MRKLAIFVVILTCGLVFGCNFEEQNPGITTVKNTSTNFDVTYQFKDKLDRTIVKGNEESFRRPLYDYINSYEPSKRVLLNTKYPHKNDVIFTFSERNSYEIKVNNAIGENATLSANGWMEVMDNITPGNTDDANHKGRIYTDKPNFTVLTTSGFPAEIIYNFSSNVFLVTIRWSS